MTRIEELKANVEKVGNNTIYHLDNGIGVKFVNEITPLIFLKGIKEIGRYNLATSRYTALQLIKFAAELTEDELTTNLLRL